MRNEIEYQMWVKQPFDQVMEQLVEDAKSVGISDDELNRFLYEWLMDRIDGVPDWMLKGLDN